VEESRLRHRSASHRCSLSLLEGSHSHLHWKSKWCKGYTVRLVTSEAVGLNWDSSRGWRNSSLWHSNTVVGSAFVGVEAVEVGPVLEEVGGPDSGKKKRRQGREGQV